VVSVEKDLNKTGETYISENIGVLPLISSQSNFRKVFGMEPMEMAFWMINTCLLVLITIKEFAIL